MLLAALIRLLLLPLVLPLRLAAAAAAAAAGLAALAAAALAPARLRPRSLGPLVLLHARVVGGYHNDVWREWGALERRVRAGGGGGGAGGAPAWAAGLPRATVFHDDQLNTPWELCRSTIGFVAPAPENGDAGAAAAAWRRHPGVAAAGLAVGVLPRCRVLAAELPYAAAGGGRLAWALAVAKVVPLALREARRGRLRAYGGVVAVCDARRVVFCFPQERPGAEVVA